MTVCFFHVGRRPKALVCCFYVFEVRSRNELVLHQKAIHKKQVEMVFHLQRRHACTALMMTAKDVWGHSVVVRGLGLQAIAMAAELKLLVRPCPCLLLVPVYVARTMSLRHRGLLRQHCAPTRAVVTTQP